MSYEDAGNLLSEMTQANGNANEFRVMAIGMEKVYLLFIFSQILFNSKVNFLGIESNDFKKTKPKIWSFRN